MGNNSNEALVPALNESNDDDDEDPHRESLEIADAFVEEASDQRQQPFMEEEQKDNSTDLRKARLAALARQMSNKN